MIPQLEHWIADAWEALASGRPRPRALHIAKLSLENYPAPSAALLFLVFADRDTRPLAVAKVARVAAGDATIEREAQALERVRRCLPAELLARMPRKVRFGRLNDRAALLLDALDGEVELHHTWSLRSVRRSMGRIAAALEWIDRAATGTPAGERTAGEWWGGRPEDALQALAALGMKRDELAALAPRLVEAWPARWPCGLVHGDFFPGNLLFGAGTSRSADWRSVAVVDWTLAEFAGPGFFDPLLYELSFAAQALRSGRTVRMDEVQAVHALPPFAAARRRWRERGVDIGIGSAARLATLVHAARRDASADMSRQAIASGWTGVLQVELTAGATAAVATAHGTP